MTTRVVSPLLVGRRTELAELDAAFEQARDSRGGTVAVAGEAGIGKSRLVEEFGTRAQAAGALLLAGGCLELGTEGLAFTPFVTALRGAARELGHEAMTGLVPGGTELARLLPELGPPPSDPADETARGRLFEAVLALLDRLGARRPTVLLVEDLHWADRSSRELFAFLVRNIAASRVLLVGTYRSDELHRRHPLRTLLAELDRDQAVRRIELPRLSRQEVGQQAAGLLGDEPDPSLVNVVYERSEGNPLFVETLLCCPDGAACGIDESLRDLLLRIVEQLPADSQQLLRLASAGGVRIGHRLLLAVSGLTEVVLTSAARPAVEANVLVADEEGYTFRHALIREAVHDELLPGEHARLHVAYAEAIEREPALVPAGRYSVEVAHHWYAAHHQARALGAAWRAAEEAGTTRAYAEQMVMLGRVLELWDALPDTADDIGLDHVAVLERAVMAALHSGDLERGLTFATAALGEVDTAREPLRSALLREQRATLMRQLGRPGSVAELREAARLTEGDPDSAVRARVLAVLAQAVALVDDDDHAAITAEALAVARRVGDRHSEAHALITTACAHFENGDVDTAFAAYRQAHDIARVLHSTELLTRGAANESDALEGLGEYERSIEVARRGQQEAQAAGVARTKGAFLAGNVVVPLFGLGRWDEAVEIAERTLQLDPPPAFRGYLTLWRAEIALARGDLTAAAGLASRARTALGDHLEEAQMWLPLARLDVALAATRGEFDVAVAATADALARASATRFARYVWPLVSTGARLVADVVRSPRTGAEHVDGLQAALIERATGLAVVGLAAPGHRALVAAEIARARGRHDAALWDGATAAWERAGDPYRLAYACYRAGEAAIAAGDRLVAAERLRRAAAIAADLGAAPLRAQVEGLSRRGRVALVESAPAPRSGERLGLTMRELEVLRLVAAGRSNGQIATALFISPKTASVHVSNILAKLGVGSRGEAAAYAHEHAIVEV